MADNRRGTAGMTLMEVLVAVSLLGLLAVGILTALRVGLHALSRGNERMMENRRRAGAQRILEQQIAGFMPVVALCSAGLTPDQPPTKMPFFEGEPQSMRFVSTYSLTEAWRGLPRILEFQVIPGQERGVRLVVNEIPYTGPRTAGMLCLPPAPDPVLGALVPRFLPVAIGPQSFVLADKLAFCRFFYLEPASPPVIQRWRPNWILQKWPLAVRIDMAPLEADTARIPPMTITAPVRFRRSPDIDYVDQ